MKKHLIKKHMSTSFFPKIFILILSIPLVLNVNAQTEKKIRKAAEENYDIENYVDAEQGFADAFTKKPSAESAYNMGNAQYKQDKFGLASESFKDAARLAQTKELKAKASFNLGNALVKEGLLEESIEAFKEAIKNNPTDQEAKHNLLKAKQMLKQQQEEQRQQQQQNEEQEKDSENQELKQQNQDSQESSEQEQNSTENNQQKEGENQSAEYNENDPSESIEQLLKIMEEEEKKVQQKLRNRQERPNKSTKRW